MSAMEATLFGKINQPVVAMAGTWDPLLPEHLEVLIRLTNHARQQNCASLLVMFDPAPAYFISKRKDKNAQWITYNDPLLTIDHVFSYGIDAVLLVNFKSEYLDCGVVELLQTIDVHVKLNEFWFGAKQSFGPGYPGSQAALIKLAKEQGIRLKRLASTTVNEVCGQIRYFVANGQPGQATHLALTPPIRKKPLTGSLTLPWASGAYRVLPLNKIADLKFIQTSDKFEEHTILLTLSQTSEKICQCAWPDTGADYLAFLVGPHDNPSTNVSALTA